MSDAEKYELAACAANEPPGMCSDGPTERQSPQRNPTSVADAIVTAISTKRYLLRILAASATAYLIAFAYLLWWVSMKVPAQTAKVDMDNVMAPAILARDATQTVEVTSVETEVATTTTQDSSSQEPAPDLVTSIITSISTEISESVMTSTSTTSEETTTLTFTTTEVVKHTRTIKTNVSTKTVHPTTTTIHPSVVTTSKVLTLSTTTTLSASANKRTLPPDMPEAATETVSPRSDLSRAPALLPDPAVHPSGNEETKRLSLRQSTAALYDRALTYTWTTTTRTSHKTRRRHHIKTVSEPMTITDVQGSTETLIVATWTTTVTVDPDGKSDSATTTQGFVAPTSKKPDPPKETPKKPDLPKPAPPPPPPPPPADPNAANCPASQNKLRLSTKFCSLVPAGNDEGTEHTKDCGDFCNKALTEACDFCWTGRKDDFAGLKYNTNYGGVGMQYGHSLMWHCCNKICECAKECYPGKDKVSKGNPPRDPKAGLDGDQKCI